MLQNQQNLGSPNQVSIVNQETVAPVFQESENNPPITQDTAISNEQIQQNFDLQNQVSNVNQEAAMQQVLYINEYGQPIAPQIAQPQYMSVDENEMKKPPVTVTRRRRPRFPDPCRCLLYLFSSRVFIQSLTSLTVVFFTLFLLNKLCLTQTTSCDCCVSIFH